MRNMKPWLWFLLAVAASVVSWSYMRRVLLPWEYFVNVQRGQLKVQMGDLYPHWWEHTNSIEQPQPLRKRSEQRGFRGGFMVVPSNRVMTEPALEIIDEQRFVYPIIRSVSAGAHGAL